MVAALGDARRLAAAIAQGIELGAAHLAAAQHLHRVDHRRIDREDALDALAIGNLTHREALVEAAAAARDAHAFVGLNAGALALLDLTLTTTVSPGWNSGTLLVLASLAACSASSV